MTVFIHTYSHLSSYIPQFACQGVDCWPSLTPGSWWDPWLTPPLLCPRPCTGRVWPPTCHVSRVQGFSAVHNSARCWPLQKVEGAQGRAALPRLAPPAATLQSFTPPTLPRHTGAGLRSALPEITANKVGDLPSKGEENQNFQL